MANMHFLSNIWTRIINKDIKLFIQGEDNPIFQHTIDLILN